MKLKDLIKVSLYYTGGYHVYSSWQRSKVKLLLVIMYHDLVEDSDASTGVAELKRDRPTRSQFVAHLKTIRRSYRVISLEDAIHEMRDEGNLREDTVAITFDDGYAAVYEIAFPELQAHALPATVFLTTDWINQQMDLWWERLTDMVNKADFKIVDFVRVEERLGIDMARNLQGLADNLSSGMPFLDSIEAGLRQKSDEELAEFMVLLEELLFQDGEYTRSLAKALTWDQIVDMSKDGINFGSHTRSHLNLRFADPDRVEREITESRNEIEMHIGKRIQGLAYPYGSDLSAYASYVPLLKQIDFDYAITSCPVINDHSNDPYLLRRSCLPFTTSSALLAVELMTCFVTTNPDLIKPNTIHI